jgi:hypothetical protein
MDGLRAPLCDQLCPRHLYYEVILQSACSLGVLNRFTNESFREFCVRPVVRGVSARRW